MSHVLGGIGHHRQEFQAMSVRVSGRKSTQNTPTQLITHAHGRKTLMHCYRCVDFAGTILKKTLMEDVQHAAPLMMQIITNSPLQTPKSMYNNNLTRTFMLICVARIFT